MLAPMAASCRMALHARFFAVQCDDAAELFDDAGEHQLFTT
jgi:hypothetical protein